MTDYRRLSPSELRAIGKSPKSRHYVRATTKNITPKTKTISARQYENKRIEKVTHGKAKTKEQFTKGVKTGAVRYVSNKQRDAIAYRKRAERIRDAIPYEKYYQDKWGEPISKVQWQRDVHLIEKFDRVRFKGLTDEEKSDWRGLFDKYPREQVLDAIGSPIVSSHQKGYRHAA
jgi:hypothetical protein